MDDRSRTSDGAGRIRHALFALLFLVIGIAPAIVMLAWHPEWRVTLLITAMILLSQGGFIAAIAAWRFYGRGGWALVIAGAAAATMALAIRMTHALDEPAWPTRYPSGRLLPGGIMLFWFLLWPKPVSDELGYLRRRSG